MCLGCLRYVNICHTHRKSCNHCHTSVIMVIRRSISSVGLSLSSLKQSHQGYILCCCPGGLCCLIVEVFQVCDHNVKFAKVQLLSTLSHFPENLSDQTTLFHQTLTKLHCVVSALTDPALLLRTTQCLRLSSRSTALCNHKDEQPICLPELCRRLPSFPN